MPYQLTYQYVDESSNAVQCNFWAGHSEKESTTTSKSYTYLYLIPGKTYKFTVEDSKGVKTSRVITLPTPSSFVDGKLKSSSIKVSWKYRYMESGMAYEDARSLKKFSAAEMMTNMTNSGYRYGLYYRISLPQLATSREFFTTIAFYAPNGFASRLCRGYHLFLLNNAPGSYLHLELHRFGFLQPAYEKNGASHRHLPGELYWGGSGQYPKPSPSTDAHPQGGQAHQLFLLSRMLPCSGPARPARGRFVSRMSRGSPCSPSWDGGGLAAVTRPPCAAAGEAEPLLRVHTAVALRVGRSSQADAVPPRQRCQPRLDAAVPEPSRFTVGSAPTTS